MLPCLFWFLVIGSMPSFMAKFHFSFVAFFSALGGGLCQRERTTLGSLGQGLQQEYTFPPCLPYVPGEGECVL